MAPGRRGSRVDAQWPWPRPSEGVARRAQPDGGRRGGSRRPIRSASATTSVSAARMPRSSPWAGPANRARGDPLRDARAVLPSRQDASLHGRDPEGRGSPGWSPRSRDPFPRVDGGGLAALAAAGVRVEVGCLAEAARELNAPYWKRLTTGKPYVTAKWAMTLDGKTAVASGDSRWISSDDSRRLVHELRGRMDAIVVGIGDRRIRRSPVDRPSPGPSAPSRMVLDSSARLAPNCILVRTAAEVAGPGRRDRPGPARSPRAPRRPRLRGARLPGDGPVPVGRCSRNWDAAG